MAFNVRQDCLRGKSKSFIAAVVLDISRRVQGDETHQKHKCIEVSTAKNKKDQKYKQQNSLSVDRPEHAKNNRPSLEKSSS